MRAQLMYPPALSSPRIIDALGATTDLTQKPLPPSSILPSTRYHGAGLGGSVDGPPSMIAASTRWSRVSRHCVGPHTLATTTSLAAASAAKTREHTRARPTVSRLM